MWTKLWIRVYKADYQTENKDEKKSDWTDENTKHIFRGAASIRSLTTPYPVWVIIIEIWQPSETGSCKRKGLEDILDKILIFPEVTNLNWLVVVGELKLGLSTPDLV